LFFVRDGEKVNPIDATGGGAVDIAAFALRVASWSMMNPRTRPVMILDEPLKNLDKERQQKGSAMIKEVSERLGIQFIIITHEEALTEYADKTFNVTIKKGISNVTD
jgi:DNA repair exonuclease SbcCD ATPase subunit